MRNRLIVFIMLGACLVFGLLFARQLSLSKGLPHEQFAEKKLRVLTYSTFVSSTGPGQEIFNRFRAEHKIDLEVLTEGDAGLLLERMKLAAASAPFDVVLGLDQLMLDQAKGFAWKPIEVPSDNWNAQVEAASPFVPFDWSPMTFIYHQGEVPQPPRSLDDLTDARYKNKIALEDPRASTPGLQFYGWVKDSKGAKTAAYLERLQPNVASVSATWAFAYGLFKRDQASMVFSYVTSLAFHWETEKDRSYQALSFAEGHPVQVEYAGVPADCRECARAQDLVRSLLEPWAQKLLMEKNFMFPVLKGVEAGTIFADLPQLRTRKGAAPRKPDFADWDQVFKR